jgi:hypothetical protein
MRLVNNSETNTVRELSAVELDQVSGGCDNCGDGGPGSCPCLPPAAGPSVVPQFIHPLGDTCQTIEGPPYPLTLCD